MPVEILDVTTSSGTIISLFSMSDTVVWLTWTGEGAEIVKGFGIEDGWGTL